MITTPHTRPFTYPIIQNYAALGLDPTKIQALYLFDPAGNLYDASGNGRHGTLEGGAIYTGQGRYGISGFTDGVDDGFRIPSFNPVGTVSTNSVFSVTFWARALTRTNNIILSQWDDNAGINQRSWKIGQLAGGPVFYVSSDGTLNEKLWVSNDFIYDLDVFAHWAFTFNGNEDGGGTAGNIKIYKNAVETSSYNRGANDAITDLHASTADIIIGGDLDNDVISSPYHMVYDVVLLYSGVLNQSQISNLHTAGL
jgi:hypothetical protein